MGTCKYCGKDAGWFSHAHSECKSKHDQGVIDFKAVVSSYFTGRCNAVNVHNSRNRLKVDAFLSEEDICQVADEEIRHYTASIHRPFSPVSMRLMDDFLNAVGVAYSSINRSGAVDEFTKKLMRGFMVEYFTGRLTLPVAHQRCEKVLGKFPMAQTKIEDAYLYVLNKAATNFMKNDTISDSDQQKIDDYVNYLQLPVNNLPVQYQNSQISRLGQISILTKLQNGIVPTSNMPAPIMLGRGEGIIWTYNGVSMYQEKTVKEYGGRRSGWSFRVMKGVTYHTGGTKIKPIEHTYMDLKGTGTLYITNKHLIFQSPTSAQKVPYTKLIGVTPYSDGIEVHRDGANTKRLTFQGFDSWFLMNVISKIANM